MTTTLVPVSRKCNNLASLHRENEELVLDVVFSKHTVTSSVALRSWPSSIGPPSNMN